MTESSRPWVARAHRRRTLRPALRAKQQKVKAGKLTQRMFDELQSIMTDVCVGQFGGDRVVEILPPQHSRGVARDHVRELGPHRVTNGVARVKSVFNCGCGRTRRDGGSG